MLEGSTEETRNTTLIYIHLLVTDCGRTSDCFPGMAMSSNMACASRGGEMLRLPPSGGASSDELSMVPLSASDSCSESRHA